MTKKTDGYAFTSQVWIYPGDTAAWHFVTLPKELGRELRERFKGIRKGFGSLPVRVTIGKTTWDTSIFPDKREDSYLLPLKASVRHKEDVYAGEKVSVTLIIR